MKKWDTGEIRNRGIFLSDIATFTNFNSQSGKSFQSLSEVNSECLNSHFQTYQTNNMWLQYKLPGKNKKGYESVTLDTKFFVVESVEY